LGEPIEYVADRLSARTSSHGIAITIRAASSTFASADGLWVTTRLQNVGTNVLHWITDGCAINVGLSARTDVDWTYGAKQPGDFGVFKDWTLERYDRNQEPHPLYLDSRPDWAVDEGEFGCADLGIGHDLKPGHAIEARHLVTATTGRAGLPPAGPILLQGTFGMWYRGGENIDEVHHKAIVVTLPVLLTDGRDPAFISPGQAVDAALQDLIFRQYVIANPAIPDFAPSGVELDAANARWLVTMTVGDRFPGSYVVQCAVDARDGQVLGVSTPRAGS
jgi:hypothetical protein